MHFDGVNLPPEGATEEWVRETKQREDVITVVPFSVEEEDTSWILGAALLDESYLSILYFDIGTWRLFSECSINHKYNCYDEELLFPRVCFQREDARLVRKLAYEFGGNLKEDYGIGFVPYVESPMDLEEIRAGCDCSSISEPQVRPAPGLSGIEDERVFMCANCSMIHGMEYNNRRIRNEKGFDANWILSGEPPDDFIEIGEDDAYLLYSKMGPPGKVDYSIALVASVGGGTSNSFSRYIPDKHNALVYMKDDTVAGYLTWGLEKDGRASHQQLFTREPFRREGVASTLVTEWADRFYEQDVFYVEEPNEKSRNLLRDFGYWSGERKPEAVEYYTLRGVGNNIDESMEIPHA